eukprot:7203838-Pyramimonas_sp.AAC.1
MLASVGPNSGFMQSARCNLSGAMDLYKRVDTFHALGLQNPCGGDCDEYLALAGASLRPRWR